MIRSAALQRSQAVLSSMFLAWAALGPALLCASEPANPPASEVWSRFRGENGLGHSDLKGLPTVWTTADYEWTRTLPGVGHSSPVVWREKLFVTSGEATGERSVHCLDARTGADLWSQTITLAASHLHKKNSYASGTPALDGERVYTAFGDEDHYLVTAWTFQGEQVWQQDLGALNSEHGQGMSPVVFDDLVIIGNQQKGPSSIVAFHRTTGEIAWKVDREYRETSFSTPFLLSHPDTSVQLICLNGATGLSGLDPLTGKEIWSSGELPQRTVGSPVYAGGLLFASCGSGGRGKYMVAVDPTGTGDVSGSHIRYVRKVGIPYVPTPIVHEDLVYLWLDDGVVICMDPKTGEDVWRERVGGNYSSSPILVDGKIYGVDEDGEVVVIDAAPVYRLHGRSPLGDSSHSTPAVANGRLYLRGFHTLASLKAGD